jgi:hypothetical protein
MKSSPERRRRGLKSRIVENWLTKVKELTFTIPFCQLLASQGKTVVHISSQGPGEQGKDVIAVDGDGVIHCYQLKCGRITSKSWASIKAEVDQLVELPPHHPSIPANVDSWEAYLVTNGGIANPTSRDITDYSEAKKKAGHRPLKTIVGSELVSEFSRYYDEFIPVDVVDLQHFLELYNQAGDFELDTADFKVFFENYFAGLSDVSLQKKKEGVRASLILCNYIITHKQAEGNHLETIKSYVLLLASIYEFADRNAIPFREWQDSERLVYESMNLEFRQLIDELDSHQHDYLEAKYGLLSEALVYKIRCSELVGYLSAYEIYCKLSGEAVYKKSELAAITARLSDHKALFGECFIPFFIARAIALYVNGLRDRSTQLVADLLAALTNSHTDAAEGLISPYYGVNDAFNWTIGRDIKVRETFLRMSYTARTVKLLAARFGLRELLNSVWPIFSRISQQEVVPDPTYGYLSWRSDGGAMTQNFSAATQSWSSLIDESNEDNESVMPDVLRSRKHFLPLLMNVMPHRLNHRFALAVLDAVGYTAPH